MSHLSLLWLYIPILITVIVLLVLGYKAIYKKNVNRVLSGQRPYSLIEPLPFIQTVVIIATLIMIVSMNTTIQALRTQIEDIRNESFVIRQRLDYARAEIGSISEQLNEMYQAQSLVHNHYYRVTSYDQVNQTIGLQFIISLKQLFTNSTIRLVAVNLSDQTEIQGSLLFPDTLNVSTELLLDTTKTYRFYIQIDSGLSLEQVYLTEINMITLLEDQFRFGVGFSSSPNTTFGITLNIWGKTYGYNGFFVQAMKLDIFDGEQLVYTVNLTNLVFYAQFPAIYTVNYDESNSPVNYLTKRYVITVDFGYGTETYHFRGPSYQAE